MPIYVCKSIFSLSSNLKISINSAQKKYHVLFQTRIKQSSLNQVNNVFLGEEQQIEESLANYHCVVLDVSFIWNEPSVVSKLFVVV